ncbi:MAG TPA: hypothetical protein VJI46_00820 [Candidatus Nanoarchaeia archaeon]|nr:hypothetical protein [Candidatus Nanoarchaeia archaeon]
MQIDAIIKKTVMEMQQSVPVKLTLVLSGSHPSERTYYKGKLLSDIDITILNNLGILYRKRLKEIAEKNSSDDVYIETDVASPQLIRNNYSIFTLELKNNGTVLCGNKKRLSRIKVTPETLPRWEGLRALFQKLMMSAYSKKGIDRIYLNAKLYFAIVDAFLCFTQNYKVTYAERMREVQKLNLPKELEEKILIAYQFKLNRLKDDRKLRKIADTNEARKYLLKYIDFFLRRYLNNNKSPIENIRAIRKKYPVRIYRNNLFYIHCPVKYLPKVSIIHFNPILFIECALTNDYKPLRNFLARPPKTFAELSEVYFSYPSLIIKSDGQILGRKSP